MLAGSRISRALRTSLGDELVDFGVFHAYDPEAFAGVLAAGLGTAGALGGGGAATGKVTAKIMGWAAEEKGRYDALPGTVVVALTDDVAYVYAWSRMMGLGKRVATWRKGDFTAQVTRHPVEGEVDIRVHPADGKGALLFARSGPLRRRSLRFVERLVQLAA